ncbi:MAG TPA: TatD family nuclease-associated radical SAM protein [Bacillota bacterium]|nr:TatD family nuclease-associated radical SAM protein [Bacillota bacterium]
MSQDKGDLTNPAMVIAYPIKDGLYLNITNRCQNACRFCIRDTTNGVGYNLWLEHEPTVEDMIKAIGNPADYREIVFCGYGEPLTRPVVVIEVSRWIKQESVSIPVRLNTNGLADLFLGYDVLPQLKGLIDVISISLNAVNASSYAEITQSEYGLKAYPALLEFIKRSRDYIPEVVVTAVNYPGVDLEGFGEIAKKLNVMYKIRNYQQ